MNGSAWSRWVLPALVGVATALLLHEGSLSNLPLREGSGDVGAVAEVRDAILERWVEEPDADDLLEGALHGMAATLDPYSAFIPPAERKQFDEQTTGRFGGLGVYITVEDRLVKVIAPIEDTPAWRAGLLPGDLVLRIDGEPYEFANATEAVESLRGEEGSEVTLTILHEGEDTPIDVTLEREQIQITTVKGTRLLDHERRIGYVRVTAFNSGTTEAFNAAIDELLAADLRGLVLDLRGNPGGFLDAARHLADVFLPQDAVIVQTRGRGEETAEQALAEAPAKLEIPVALLLDRGSASASEILGGALRDHQIATLVGTRSYGKGSVQSLIPVIGGKAKLKLTTQYYFTPSGRRIHRSEGVEDDDDSWGLLPDIEVVVDLRDRQEHVRAESEAEMERLKVRATGSGELPEERLHRDDPQVAAAFNHVVAVLAGEATIGTQPAPPPSEAPVIEDGESQTAAIDSETPADLEKEH